MKMGNEETRESVLEEVETKIKSIYLKSGVKIKFYLWASSLKKTKRQIAGLAKKYYVNVKITGENHQKFSDARMELTFSTFSYDRRSLKKKARRKRHSV